MTYGLAGSLPWTVFCVCDEYVFFLSFIRSFSLILGSSRHVSTRCLAHVFWHIEKRRDVKRDVLRLSGSMTQRSRRDKHDKRDTQHKRKCGAHSLAANSSANVSLLTIRLLFWLVHYRYVVIMTLSLSPRIVIDVVQSEGKLHQIGSLRKTLTIIDDGHVGIWARHARLCCGCRDMTWRAKWNLDYRLPSSMRPEEPGWRKSATRDAAQKKPDGRMRRMT